MGLTIYNRHNSPYFRSTR